MLRKQSSSTGSKKPVKSIVDRYTGQTLTWGMTLDEYEPIKAIGPCPKYIGPRPPYIGHVTTRKWSTFNLYGTQDFDSILYDESVGFEHFDSMSRDELLAEQKRIEPLYNLQNEIYTINSELSDKWHKIREPHRRQFFYLMDKLSSLRCYECEYIYPIEHDGRTKSACDCSLCEVCGDKYCDGCPEHDEY